MLTVGFDATDMTFLKKALAPGVNLQLDKKAEKEILRCRHYLDKKMEKQKGVYYGINTGFGFLQHVRIDKKQLNSLQNNLLKSHACGMGDEVPAPIIRLMLLLKAKSLSFGHSGVQAETVNRLIDMFNHDVLPIVYTQGSLGASGDLAPLSHLCLPLIGEGEVTYLGKKQSAKKVFAALKWKPVNLQSKEGLALINGTQFMSAYGVHCLLKAEHLLNWANFISAISTDAFDCLTEPFHPRIHAIRPHPGQSEVAGRLRALLKGSPIAKRTKQQVQDPYSFRCIPQIHGASLDSIRHVREVFLREVNAVTDNPNIFPEEDLIISGGNFHGQPLAMALDYLCIAMSELGNISERRTYQLISGQRGLPPFLIKNPGLHSGMMIPQYTAAGIASENKQLCTPASVDSIPSSNNQEDHVSMGANAAVKCSRVIDNVERILAIELLNAAQALEFRRPLKSSAVIESLIREYRKAVPFNREDRILHDDMIKTVAFLQAEPPLT